MAGLLVQSPFGEGNFEAITVVALGGLGHWWRDNDAEGFPWIGPQYFGSGDVAAASLTLSNFEGGNLELVTRTGNQLVFYSRDHDAPWHWSDPLVITAGVTGAPGLTQGRYGEQGNFEVVAPLAGGGLGHWWRDNDADGFPWHGPYAFGAGPFHAAALIHGRLGSGDHLEVVARSGSALVHYWRDDDGAWYGPAPIATGISGSPAFVQSHHGEHGNFEMVAPLASGRLAHYWRDNDADGFPWHGPTVFGSAAPVESVGLIDSSATGHLEVVARAGDRLEHYWRDDDGAWHGPDPIADLAERCPEGLGQSRVTAHTGVVPIHMGLLHTGRVVMFAFSDHDADHAVSTVFDPNNGISSTPPGHETPHVFCSGHVFLGDGRLFVAGGHLHHVAGAHQFTPDGAVGHWHTLPSMQAGRWYPTCTTLPDGKVLIISGSSGGPVSEDVYVNNTCEVFTPTDHGGVMSDVMWLLPRPFSAHFPPSFETIDLYPFMHVLPWGKIFVHSRNTTRFMRFHDGEWLFDADQIRNVSPFSRSYPGAGTSVLLPLRPRDNYRARVLIVGGGGADREDLSEDTPAAATAEIIDLDARSMHWRTTAHPPQRARVMPDSVLLPDGKVLIVGGSRTGKADHATDPVLDVELFDPDSEFFSLLCPMRVPRLYHATALLLPDGRVLMAGKDALFNPAPYNYPEHRIETFSPWYVNAGERPRILGAPAAAGYDAPIDIETPDAAAHSSVVLIRNGAVTHSFNMDQRFVELTIVERRRDALVVRSPRDAWIAPPGYYMLFVLSGQGIPSVAASIRIG